MASKALLDAVVTTDAGSGRRRNRRGRGPNAGPQPGWARAIDRRLAAREDLACACIRGFSQGPERPASLRVAAG